MVASLAPCMYSTLMYIYSAVLDKGHYKEITAVSHGKEYALRFYRNKDVGMGL